MNQSQQRQIDRLRRVAGFGSRHEKEFSATSKGHALFSEIVDLLIHIEALNAKVMKKAAAKASAAANEVRLQELREHLEWIAGTARLIEKYNPALAGQCMAPDKRQKKALVNTARQFLAEAEPLQEEFFAYEMPHDFLDDLRATIAEFEPAPIAEGQRPFTRQEADALIKDTLKRGPGIIESLDVVVRNKYRDQKAVLADWKKASRV